MYLRMKYFGLTKKVIDMNTMNTLKYTLMLLAGALLFASCSEDDTFITDIEDGNNLAGFTDNSQSVANIANGDEYPVEVTMKLTGPSVNELTGDYTATIQPDWEGIPENERAEEGTHFRLDNNQVTFEESNNYLATFNFTMLSQGINAPLDDSPQFNLRASEVSGGEGVNPSGKALVITLNYACPSNLQGVYNVNVNNGAETFSDVNVVKTGVGEYDTNLLGPFGPAHQPPNNFTRGLIINDVCGTISVPEQTLAQFSNPVVGVNEHEVVGDAQTPGGVTSFTVEYEIDGYGTQTSVYTYQGPLPE